MTQLKMDSRARCRGVIRFALAIVGLALAPWGMAQVDVANTVQKVETYVDDDGQVQRRLVGAHSVVPGDELRYTISFTNAGSGEVDAGSILITNPIPESTEYIDGTAFGTGTEILFSIDQGDTFAEATELTVTAGPDAVSASAQDYTTIQWQFQPELAPGETGHVSFNVRLK